MQDDHTLANISDIRHRVRTSTKAAEPEDQWEREKKTTLNVDDPEREGPDVTKADVREHETKLRE